MDGPRTSGEHFCVQCCELTGAGAEDNGGDASAEETRGERWEEELRRGAEE